MIFALNVNGEGMKSSPEPLILLGDKKPISFSFSFGGRIVALIVLLVLVLVLPLTSYLAKQERSRLYDEKIKSAKVLIEYLALNAAIPLLGEDPLGLNVLVKEARHLDGFVYAMILDPNGKIKAHTDSTRIGTPAKELEGSPRPVDLTAMPLVPTPPPGVRVLNLAMPVKMLDQIIGTAYVGLSPEIIRREIEKGAPPIFRRVLAYTLVGLGIFVGLFLLLRKRLSEPVFKILGCWEWQARDSRDADPGQAGLTAPGVNRNQVAVLFAGIKGFRAYANTRELSEVLNDLNGYLQIINKSILEHGGYVDNFVGDAVIGVFESSPLKRDHTARAVRSAMEMQGILRKAGGNGNPLLSKVGIGISSGVVLTGRLGSQGKGEHKVIGESFKWAYTLNVMAGPGEIVVSRDVYQSIAGMVSAEPLPPREMIQRTESWESFRLHRIVE